MANDLAVYGVSQNKWFIAKVKGGLENDRDLWRGVIDGDGSIGIYQNRPTIQLTGSLHVCLQFKAFLENQLDLPMPNVAPYKNSYKFSVSNHRADGAIRLLYENCTVALDRKREIAKRILNAFQVQGTSRYLTRLSEPTQNGRICKQK